MPERVIREEAALMKVTETLDDTLSVIDIQDNHHFEKGDKISLALTSMLLKRVEINIRRQLVDISRSKRTRTR